MPFYVFLFLQKNWRAVLLVVGTDLKYSVICIEDCRADIEEPKYVGNFPTKGKPLSDFWWESYTKRK